MYRKIALCLGISLLLFGLLAVAETAIPETPGAHVGGTLTIGVSQTFKDLDPRVSNSAYDAYVYGEIFDDLIALDPDTLKPIPQIAKSWMVSDDGSTSVFYLNEGIKFSNGEDLTAEDVAYTSTGSSIRQTARQMRRSTNGSRKRSLLASIRSCSSTSRIGLRSVRAW